MCIEFDRHLHGQFPNFRNVMDETARPVRGKPLGGRVRLPARRFRTARAATQWPTKGNGWQCRRHPDRQRHACSVAICSHDGLPEEHMRCVHVVPRSRATGLWSISQDALPEAARICGADNARAGAVVRHQPHLPRRFVGPRPGWAGRLNGTRHFPHLPRLQACPPFLPAPWRHDCLRHRAPAGKRRV